MDRGFKQTITATELKNNLGKYLDHVIDNNEVVITKNGTKAARLSPYITDYDQYYVIREKAEDYLHGQKKISYEEFMEIYENSELRMEYINGEIVLLASPTMEHQEISGNLHIILRDYLKGKACKVFYAPFDVHFFKQNFKEPDVMQPDLLIACDTENTNEKGRYMGTPTLVIEILSPSTRRKDLFDKLNTYCLSGVTEFWVVDPKNKSVLVYKFSDFSVDQIEVFHIDDAVKSFRFNDLEVAVTDIFSTE